MARDDDNGMAEDAPAEYIVPMEEHPDEVVVAPERTLPVVWREAAERMEVPTLATAASAGVVAVILLGVIPSPYWPLLLPKVFIGAFGGWGLAHRAQRALTDDSNASGYRSLSAIKGLLALIAGGSVVVAAIMLFSIAMPSWCCSG